MTTSTPEPLTITIDDIVQTRDEPTRMRWPRDPETTRSLTLLTHDRIPWRRRLLRWWERRVTRRLK